MNKKRVFHIVENIAGVHGGSTSAAFAIANLSCDRPPSVVVGLDFGGAVTSTLAPGVELLRIRARRGLLGLLRRICSVVGCIVQRRDSIAIIEFHNVFTPLFLVGGAVSWALRIPIILNPHNSLDENDLRKRYLLKWIVGHFYLGHLLTMCTLVRCATERECSRLVSFGWRVTKSWSLLPIDVVPMDSRGRRNESNSLQILFCSRIDRKKRLELVIEAVRLVVNNGKKVRLCVAGDGDPGYRDEIMQMAASYGLVDLIEWTGFVAGDRKRELFERANVFVLPSLYENYGIVVIEAICAGLRPILSPDVFIADHLGSVCSPIIVDGTEALVDALEVVATNRAAGLAPSDAVANLQKLLSGSAGAEGITRNYSRIEIDFNGMVI